MVELPLPCERLIACPKTGTLLASLIVTVKVVLDAPFAITLTGEAVSVDSIGFAKPGKAAANARCVLIGTMETNIDIKSNHEICLKRSLIFSAINILDPL